MQFSQVIGHKKLKQKLVSLVQEGRIPHAQLFLGPEGAGKMALALAYASYLNCGDRKAEDSCGICPSCQKFAKLAHPDLHFIYPVATTATVKEKPRSIDFIHQWRAFLLAQKAYASLQDWYEHIGIEKKQGIINTYDCNEILRTLSYTSYEGRYKIMILWMAEKLYHAAAPKILKVLEEPPDKTIFLLLAENADLILPTILSRTQLTKISRPAEDELIGYLQQQGQQNTAELQRLISQSNGNYIELRRLLETRSEDENAYLQFRNWMLFCYKLQVPELIKLIDAISKNSRDRVKAFLAYGITVFRYGLHFSVLQNPAIHLEEKEHEFVRNFSKYVHPANVDALFKLFNEAIFHIERNGNIQLTLMDVSLKTAQLLKAPRT